MPFKQIIPEPPRAYPELTDALTEELRLARPDGPEDAPYIIEEHSPRHGFLHIQVIWDAWQDVPPRSGGALSWTLTNGCAERSKSLQKSTRFSA